MIKNKWSSGDPIQYDYQNIARISPHLQVCVIATEDQKFGQHSGWDVEAIQKAIRKNKKGKRKLGASTISQQVSKNVFLYPKRSYVRKVLEMYMTFWTETLWPKHKILEMYLNVAEMGPGIYGAEAASRHYFRKPASKLTLSESAALASILPSPRKYKVKNPGPYVYGRQQQVKKLYRSLGGHLFLKDVYVKYTPATKR
jgi:monofunctional biosynthetic peptidoglycan transglycosylase